MSLFENRFLQKNGKASPSIATSLIECLPDEDDPERPTEERVAKNVLFAAYIGALWCVQGNHGHYTDSCIITL